MKDGTWGRKRISVSGLDMKKKLWGQSLTLDNRKDKGKRIKVGGKY